MEHLESFESAAESLGLSTALPGVENISEKHQKATVAAYKLFVISEAAWKREKKQLDWNDSNQAKYYPWFDLEDSSGSAPGFSCNVCNYVRSYSGVGSRLVFPTRAIAEYVGKTHVEIYKDFMLIG